jgi:predicted dehydrogenase
VAVTVGVIGAGFGRRTVVPAFEAAGCAVTGPVSARDDAAVQELCRSELDLVCVHSPPFLHARHVTWALEAGRRAVLCDKPFGCSGDEAQAMFDGARAAGILHLLNFEFRLEPARVEVAERLAAGDIGPVEHVEWTALTAGSRHPLRRYGWLFDPTRGGGWIGAWGSHAVDALRWWVGEVVDVTSAPRTTITERPDEHGVLQRCTADDGFTAALRLSTGATAMLDSSFASAVTLPARLVITGRDGTIEVVNDHHITLRRADGSREESTPPGVDGDPHAPAMTAWARTVAAAVAEGRQIGPSFADGVACARVLDALRLASSLTPEVEHFRP